MHSSETLRGFVSTKTVGHIFLVSLLLLTWTESSTCRVDQLSSVEVLIEHVERISNHEAHFRVRITNTSKQPVFLTGIIYESRSILSPIYLEQQRAAGGWKIVVPCLDMAPPRVIKLEPAKPMIEDLVLKVPLEGVCKERNIQLEGKFRFRVNYFEREGQARAFLKKFFSKGGQEAHAADALSEPFEIPPLRG
jgi:hypothetical protein